MTSNPHPTRPRSATLRRLCHLLILCSFASNGLKAQDKGSPETKENEKAIELSVYRVVSGEDTGYISRNTLGDTRSNERLINIPQNIQIINNELLNDLNQTFGFDAVKYGASGMSRRSTRTDDAYIRGFRANRLMRDGITSTAGTINSIMYDVDRVEVVKGPAALLYGQSSFVGGVMNYITKQPTRTFSASTRATIGTNDFYKFEFNASGPTVLDNVRYRVTLGTQDNKEDRRFGYHKDYFVGGALEWDAGPKTTVSLGFSYMNMDSFTDYTFANATGTIAPRPDDFSVNEAISGFENDEAFIKLMITSSLSPSLDMRIFSSYQYSRREGAQSRGTTLAADGFTIARFVQPVDQTAKPTSLLVDLVHTYEFTRAKNKLAIGVEARRGSEGSFTGSQTLASLDTLNPVYGSPVGTAVTGVAWSQTYDLQRGIYLTDQLSFWRDKLIAVAGVRYNGFSNDSTNLASAARPVTKFADDATVKRLGLIYKPVTYASFYYNNSESFLYNTGVDDFGRPWLPSFGVVDEVGAKFEGFNGAVFATVTYFDNKLTNVRTFVILPGTNTQTTVQTGEESSRGYEIDVGLSKTFAAGDFNLTAHYYSGKSETATGARPIYAPKDTLSGFAHFRFTNGAVKGLGLGFGAYHVSDRLGTGSFVFAPHTVAVANISYDYKKWRVSLNVDNLFDKLYADGSEGQLWVFTGARRNFKFSTDYRF